MNYFFKPSGTYMPNFNYEILTSFHPDILSKRLLLGLTVGAIVGQCNQIYSICTMTIAPTFTQVISHTMISSLIYAMIFVHPTSLLMYISAVFCLMIKHLPK